MKGFVAEDGEGEGLLGVFVYAQAGRWNHLDAGKRRVELRKNEWVARASARDDELVEPRSGKDKTVQGVHDGKRGEDGCRTHEVFLAGFVAATQAEKPFDKRRPIAFPSRALRRRKA